MHSSSRLPKSAGSDISLSQSAFSDSLGSSRLSSKSTRDGRTTPAQLEKQRLNTEKRMNKYYDKLDSIMRAHPNEIEMCELGRVAGLPIHALHIKATHKNAPRIFISGGVHGNEPSGIWSALKVAQDLCDDQDLKGRVDVSIIPMVSPRGYRDRKRTLPTGIDPNRSFQRVGDPNMAPALDSMGRPKAQPKEIGIIRDYVLKERPFDLAVDLHSGVKKRKGFWILHSGSAEFFKGALTRFEGPKLGVNEGKPYTLTQPGLGVSQNEGTLKDLLRTRAREAATIESPGGLLLKDQVEGQSTLVKESIRESLNKSRGIRSFMTKFRTIFHKPTHQ